MEHLTFRYDLGIAMLSAYGVTRTVSMFMQLYRGAWLRVSLLSLVPSWRQSGQTFIALGFRTLLAVPAIRSIQTHSSPR